MLEHLFPLWNETASTWYLLCVSRQCLILSDCNWVVHKSFWSACVQTKKPFCVSFLWWHCVLFLLFIAFPSSHSLYLFKLGLAPQIQDLYGKVDFTGKSESKSVHLVFLFLSLFNPVVPFLNPDVSVVTVSPKLPPRLKRLHASNSVVSQETAAWRSCWKCESH